MLSIGVPGSRGRGPNGVGVPGRVIKKDQRHAGLKESATRDRIGGGRPAMFEKSLANEGVFFSPAILSLTIINHH